MMRRNVFVFALMNHSLQGKKKQGLFEGRLWYLMLVFDQGAENEGNTTFISNKYI